jgi:hypothetical protein
VAPAAEEVITDRREARRRVGLDPSVAGDV